LPAVALSVAAAAVAALVGWQGLAPQNKPLAAPDIGACPAIGAA
jgi:hypothetical protein